MKNMKKHQLLVSILVILAILYILYNMYHAYENFLVYNSHTSKVQDTEYCAQSDEIPDCVNKGCTWANHKCRTVNNKPLFYPLFA